MKKTLVTFAKQCATTLFIIAFSCMLFYLGLWIGAQLVE